MANRLEQDEVKEGCWVTMTRWGIQLSRRLQAAYPACRSWRPQLNPHMLHSLEDLMVTSSLKGKLIYHRDHKSGGLTSPARSSRSNYLLCHLSYPLCKCQMQQHRTHGWYSMTAHCPTWKAQKDQKKTWFWRITETLLHALPLWNVLVCTETATCRITRIG